MRIPKYRAFIKSLQTMVQVERINFDTKTIEFGLSDNADWWEYDFDEVKLMQSPELYDSTTWQQLTEEERTKWTRDGNMPSEWQGREIYEGDVIHLSSNDGINYNALVIFKDGGFCAIDGTEDDYSVRRYGLMRHELQIVVIGNTWEHPELLEVAE